MVTGGRGRTWLHDGRQGERLGCMMGGRGRDLAALGEKEGEGLGCMRGRRE